MIEEWKWYAGVADEFFVIGPMDSREEIIAEAIAQGLGEDRLEDGTMVNRFFVAEGNNPPLELADWIDFSALIEMAEDRLAEGGRIDPDFDDRGVFVTTQEQHAALIEILKKATRLWQKTYKLRFNINTLAGTRNEAQVTIKDIVK